MRIVFFIRKMNKTTEKPKRCDCCERPNDGKVEMYEIELIGIEFDEENGDGLPVVPSGKCYICQECIDTYSADDLEIFYLEGEKKKKKEKNNDEYLE